MAATVDWHPTLDHAHRHTNTSIDKCHHDNGWPVDAAVVNSGIGRQAGLQLTGHHSPLLLRQHDSRALFAFPPLAFPLSSPPKPSLKSFAPHQSSASCNPPAGLENSVPAKSVRSHEPPPVPAAERPDICSSLRAAHARCSSSLDTNFALSVMTKQRRLKHY